MCHWSTPEFSRRATSLWSPSTNQQLVPRTARRSNRHSNDGDLPPLRQTPPYCHSERSEESLSWLPHYSHSGKHVLCRSDERDPSVRSRMTVGGVSRVGRTPLGREGRDALQYDRGWSTGTRWGIDNDAQRAYCID